MSGQAKFRTTAQGRAEIIEYSEAIRAEMRAKHELWLRRNAPTEPAPFDDEPRVAPAASEPPRSE